MRPNSTPRLCAGPAPASPDGAQVTKFWNIASTGDDTGEIVLYGDVMSRRPTDWWTGEPLAGLYITPEGVLEDLEAVKGKSNITIKINSCGGDLYTGIAIHNAIKGLEGTKTVIVEGIAASAASVIMCAGDDVQVYPGSMVMIHGVSGLLYDYYNLADLKKLQKDFDASERAIAEIYHAKTGIAVDQLRSMMTRETVVLLSHKKADSYIHIDVEFGEGEGKIPVDSIAKRAEAYKPKEKVTYKMIKEYIEAKYGFKVHTAYIAEVKRDLGLPMYDAPNAVEELKQPKKHPTPEKVEAIKDALRYFAVI